MSSYGPPGDGGGPGPGSFPDRGDRDGSDRGDRSRGSRRRRSRSYSPSPDRRGRSRSRSPRGRNYRDRSYSPSPRSRRYRDEPRYRGGPPPPHHHHPPPPPHHHHHHPPPHHFRDYPPPRYGGPPPFDEYRYPPRGGPYRDHGPPPSRGGGGGHWEDPGGPPPRGRGGGAEGGRRERGRDMGPPGVSLLIRNVAPTITTEDLQTAFGRIGEVRDVYIPRDYHSNQPKGFAFIEYATPEMAKEAREEMDRFPVKGRELEVVFAQERRKTPNEMRGRVVNQQNRSDDGQEERRPPENFQRSSSFERHKQRERDGGRGDRPEGKSDDGGRQGGEEV